MTALLDWRITSSQTTFHLTARRHCNATTTTTSSSGSSGGSSSGTSSGSSGGRVDWTLVLRKSVKPVVTTWYRHQHLQHCTPHSIVTSPWRHCHVTMNRAVTSWHSGTVSQLIMQTKTIRRTTHSHTHTDTHTHMHTGAQVTGRWTDLIVGRLSDHSELSTRTYCPTRRHVHRLSQPVQSRTAVTQAQLLTHDLTQIYLTWPDLVLVTERSGSQNVLSEVSNNSSKVNLTMETGRHLSWLMTPITPILCSP